MTLTDRDLTAIKDLVKITIDEELEEKLNEKLKYFPSKEEFFSKMDEIVAELQNMRESQEIITHKVYEDLVPRLEKVEGKLKMQPAV